MTTFHAILREVAAARGLTVDELTGPLMRKHLHAARVEAVNRAKAETTLTTTQLGRMLGGRHHTTVINMLRPWRGDRSAPAERTPVAWRVKDYTDGWIYYAAEGRARHEAGVMGDALVQALYL